MVVPPPPFVDHYEVLGSDRNGAPCTPSTPIAELRRAYFDRLRAYHPDKRQTSINGLGHKVTQALNEAWSILQDPDKKQAYDVIWRREKGSAGEKPAREFNLPPKVPGRRNRRASSEPPEDRRQEPPPQPRPPPPPPPPPPAPQRPSESPRKSSESPRKCSENRRPANGPRANTGLSFEERAEAFRKEGNELYKTAQMALTAAKERGEEMPLIAKTGFHAAIAKYSLGVELNRLSHVLRTNRALCYVAFQDWQRVREDARKATQLKPDFYKGWYLLVKAMWKDGVPEMALKELDIALRIIPDSPELLALQSDIEAELNRPDTAPPPEAPRRPATPPRCSSCPPGGRAPPPYQPRVPPGQPPVDCQGPAAFFRRAAAAAANHFNSRPSSAEGSDRENQPPPQPNRRRGRLPSLGKMAARSKVREASSDVY